MFKNKDDRRFHLHRKRTECRKLIVDRKQITKDCDLLDCWKKYFGNLSQSHTGLQQSDSCIQHMEALSFGFCDQILDDPLTTEEIEMAVRKIKSNRSGGADGLTAEHLKHGGPAVVVWLKRIFNLIISLEQVPCCLKLGVIVPVFKGKGRDPLSCNNYRGITLTSVISKCLEVVILDRLGTLFL